ncbi:MAG TPA: HAMP domain-containing sensor histidine kinase [Galbitalea sp.]
MLGGIFILVLISLGSKVASDVPNVLGFGAIILLASALALFPPWHRLPRGSLISVAVVDVLILAMLETELFGSQPGLSVLVLIPTLWLAFSFGVPGVIVAILGDYLVALLPYALSGLWPATPDTWGDATMVPAVVSAVGVAVYVTARHIQKQRAQLTRAYERLEKAVDSRDEFLQTISHELRTPLTSMMGYLEVIEDSVDLEQEGIAEPFAIVERNGQRLLSLINALIMEAHGRPAPVRRPEIITDLAETALEAARPAAARAGVAVGASQFDPLTAEVDAGEIAEVFNELLSNAIKFNHSGGTVSLSIARDDKDAVIRVVDSGMGIPVADRTHIFDRFFRGPAAQRAVIAGSGLGLSTVKTIVDSHDGRIVATNAQPHGTTIEVRLPLVIPRAAVLQRS